MTLSVSAVIGVGRCLLVQYIVSSWLKILNFFLSQVVPST